MRSFPKLFFSVNFLYLVLIAAEIAAIIFLCFLIPSYLPVAAAVSGMWVLSFIAAIVAAVKTRPKSLACSVLLFITALPVAGAILYFIWRFGKNKGAAISVEGPVPDGFSIAAKNACGTCAAGYDKVVYLENGAEYFRLLINEIEKAEKSVYLEYYIVSRGKIFTEVYSALKIARERGAEIKFVLDGVGSAFRLRGREIRLLKKLGAELKIFHRLTPLPYSRLNFRDHRKIAVIDGKVAFTGGINLADEYANIDSPHGYWKDTSVAVYGEVAKVFEALFLSVFCCKRELKVEGKGNRICLPYYDSPTKQAGFCENAYCNAIAEAKIRVHIFTPYFCVSDKLESALAFAALRGVDVRVIIPHIPDKKFAFELSRAGARRLSEKGVKFFEFTPGFMHAKSLICDDKVFIGTYNFDYRSMYLNYECGILFDGDITEEIERDFKNCTLLSAPFSDFNLSAWRKAKLFFLNLFAPLI